VAADLIRAALDRTPPASVAELAAWRDVAWEAPLLPPLRRPTVPRWRDTLTWMPPGTVVLVRHRSTDGTRYVHTNDRRPPRGFEIDFDLGVTHRHGELGTRRLIAGPDQLILTSVEGELDAGFSPLGFVETAPLPLFNALELRRDPVNGAAVLVAGPHDPLWTRAQPIATLGFIEGFPVEPRRLPDPEGFWGLTALGRRADDQKWRHEYDAFSGSDARDGDVVALGGLWNRDGPGFVALSIDERGRLVSELVRQERSRPSARELGKWVAAPLAWERPRVPLWALRATASRALAVPIVARPVRPRPGRLRVLGYLRREAAVNWSPLFSATHPSLNDQFVTRSEVEAADLGYVIDGVLGHSADSLAAARPRERQPEIRWGYRFGQRRRYREGPTDTA
jgi:hypothetical protein